MSSEALETVTEEEKPSLNPEEDELISRS